MPRTSLHSVGVFSGLSVSLNQALLSVENYWVPLKSVLWVVGDVALFYYPPCSDSIKPSLQFSCHFAVSNVSEGSLFPNFVTPMNPNQLQPPKLSSSNCVGVGSLYSGSRQGITLN
jgi:hypothetical protein